MPNKHKSDREYVRDVWAALADVVKVIDRVAAGEEVSWRPRKLRSGIQPHPGVLDAIEAARAMLRGGRLVDIVRVFGLDAHRYGIGLFGLLDRLGCLDPTEAKLDLLELLQELRLVIPLLPEEEPVLADPVRAELLARVTSLRQEGLSWKQIGKAVGRSGDAVRKLHERG